MVAQVKKIVISGLIISAHAVFGATFTYLIDTSYPKGIPWFGLIIGDGVRRRIDSASLCLGAVLGPMVRTAYRWTERKVLFMISLAGARVMRYFRAARYMDCYCYFVMITSTALGTIMDAMASDARRALPLLQS